MMYELITPPEKFFTNNLHHAEFAYQRFDTIFPLPVKTPSYKTMEELDDHILGVKRDAVLVNYELVIKSCIAVSTDKNWTTLKNGLNYFYAQQLPLTDICKFLLRLRDTIDQCVNKGEPQNIKNVNILLKYCTNYLNS